MRVGLAHDLAGPTALLVVGLGALSAAAQTVHDDLPDCPADFVIWDDACTATAVLRCANGDLMTLDHTRPDGGEVGTRFAPDGDVLYSYDVETGEGVGPRIGLRDPLSITDLRRWSLDRFDATRWARLPGHPDQEARVWGEARLDVGAATIDGRTLLTGNYLRSVGFELGTPVATLAVELFLDPALGLILFGRGDATVEDGEPVASGGRPTRFFEKDAPDFAAAFDLGAGCERPLSSLPVPELPHG